MSTAVNVASDTGLPSSRTVKSSCRRPRTGPPPFSVTTTSTSTTLTPVLNGGCGVCATDGAARKRVTAAATSRMMVPLFSRTGEGPFARIAERDLAFHRVLLHGTGERHYERRSLD